MAYRHEIKASAEKIIGMLQRHFDYFDTPKPKISKPLTVMLDGTKTYAQKILDQMTVLVQGHLPRLDYIRGLVSEDRWKNYKALDIQGLREQKMYKDAHRRLMDGWKFTKQRKQKKKSKKA